MRQQFPLVQSPDQIFPLSRINWQIISLTCISQSSGMRAEISPYDTKLLLSSTTKQWQSSNYTYWHIKYVNVCACAKIISDYVNFILQKLDMWARGYAAPPSHTRWVHTVWAPHTQEQSNPYTGEAQSQNWNIPPPIIQNSCNSLHCFRYIYKLGPILY